MKRVILLIICLLLSVWPVMAAETEQAGGNDMKIPWQATTGNVSIERMDLKSIPVEDEKTSGRGSGGRMYYGCFTGNF